MKTYEALFVLDPALATNWPAAEAEINRFFGRAEAKPLGMKNWGERKLAYSIGQHKRGLYALTFFQAAPEKIAGLERDVQLSEQAIRVLVIRREAMTQEAIEKALAAEPPPKAPVRGSDEWSPRPRAFGPGAGADFADERAPARAAEQAATATAGVEEELGAAVDADNPGK